jgi:glycosyltransferase involved in cell wall biosynthesis
MALAEPDPSRPAVLVLLCAYLPGYKAGGPIRSISNLVSAFGEEYHFRIVTMDRDLGERSPYPGVVTKRWVRVGKADVLYLRAGLHGFLKLVALLGSVDRSTVLYVNSFFNRPFSMLAMLMRWLKLCQPRCLVVAPRGEFSQGAIGIKHRRKQLYITISRWLGWYRNTIWQASSDFEAEDIRREFGQTCSISVAGIVPEESGGLMRGNSLLLTAMDIADRAAAKPSTRPAKKPGQLRAVFVSRLSRKKNLHGALEMLSGVSGDVTFDIYGPAEDLGYWAECQTLIAALPPNIRVQYWGEIEHRKVRQVFAEHDLFLFPTLGENYGHVISESLAAGCPVLISDRTPWRNLEAQGVGWDIPLDEPDRFRSVLQQCVDGDDSWFSALSKRAAELAMESAASQETIDANRRLFQRAFAWSNPC